MKKLSISLLALVMMTLIWPCFQCATMDMGIPTAQAMGMNADNSTDCATSMEKSSHAEMKNCRASTSSHHKANLDSNIINPTLSDFHKFKSLPFLHGAVGLSFHGLHPVIKQMVTRGPPSSPVIKKIPPSFPGIIVKKE